MKQALAPPLAGDPSVYSQLETRGPGFPHSLPKDLGEPGSPLWTHFSSMSLSCFPALTQNWVLFSIPSLPSVKEYWT